MKIHFIYNHNIYNASCLICSIISVLEYSLAQVLELNYVLVWLLYEFLFSNITFIALNLHQKTDSKFQQPRIKSKELNGSTWGWLGLFTVVVNVYILGPISLKDLN